MKKISVIGIILGLIAGLTWGIETTFIGIVGGDADLTKIAVTLAGMSVVTACIHDTFSAGFMWVYMLIKRNLIGTLKKFKTRSGLFVVLGALLGGPVGMAGYVLSINNLGASYTAAISAVFPAVGALFAYIILKDKLSVLNWGGLILSIASVIILYSDKYELGENLVLGIVFILMCVLGWSIEATICAYGMKDGEIDSDESILVRQSSSAVTFAIVIVPLLSSHAVSIKFFESKMIWYLLAAAFVATISYLVYYKCINMIGPIRAMSTNITYVAWAFIIGIVFMDEKIDTKSMILSVLIIAGSIISVLKIKEKPEIAKQ